MIDLSSAKPIRKKTSFMPLLSLLLLISVSVITFTGVTQTKRYFARAEDKQPHQVADLTQSYAALSKKPRTEVIGFLPSWSVANGKKVHLENLTQIIYFGLEVDEKGNLVKINEKGEEVYDWTNFKSEYFQQIKQEAQKQNIKVLISIKNFNGATINQIISNPKATANLISQLNILITEYDLDGVNIDFEYFSFSTFPTMKHLNTFLETVNSEIKKEHSNTIISFDVNATVVFQDNAYDMVKIGETVDQVILMAYDYHRADSTKAGPVSPLDGTNGLEHSINESLDSLIGRVPLEKIILAVPFYGYEWQTKTTGYKSETVNNTGASATYERVRQLIDTRTNVQIYWHELSASPWLVYRHNGLIKQIYYEDERSLAKKIEFMQQNQLGGMAIWALGYEGNYESLWVTIKDKLSADN